MKLYFNIRGNIYAAERPLALRPFRAFLMSGTMLTAIALLPDVALATDECGSIAATKNCTNLNYVPNNTIPTLQNGGIEYTPTGAQNPFTLNIGNGTTPTGVVSQDITGVANLAAAAALNRPIAGNGVTVANYTLGLVSGGVPTDVVVNVNQLASINAQRDGVFVWTDGTGNDATINNSGLVTAGGVGLNAVAGNPLASPTGSGDAKVTNNANAAVQSVGNSINVWSESGNATAINNGTLVSTNGSGIVTTDSLTGLVPTGGKATATNNFVINANKSGIIVASQGTATGTNSATGNITATNGIGISALSIGADATATNDGTIKAGGSGLVVGAATTGTATNTRTVTAGGSGAIVLSGDNSTVTNSGTLTANGGIGASATSLNANAVATVTNSGTLTSTTNIGAISTSLGTGGNAVVTNSKTINAQTGGVVALGANDATVTNTGGTITTATGTGVSATALGNDSRVDSATGTVTSNNGSGIIALAGHDAIVNSGTVTATNGLVGVAAIGANSGTATLSGDVGGASFGVAAGSGGAGDATIQTAVGADVVVNAQDVGLLAVGTGTGNSVISGDHITTISQGTGVVGLALGAGNVNISAGPVTANNGAGIFGLALGGGVTINGDGPITATNGDGATGIAINGASNVTTNQLVTVTNGNGVTSTSIGNNATATNNDKVSVTNGLVGVSSLAIGGDANTNINADITGPGPLVGGSAIGTNATVTVADNTTVNATGLGLNALSAGGDAKIQGANSIVNSGGAGGLSTALGGNSTIDLGAITADNGSAAVSTAIGGDSNVTTHGAVKATNGSGLISTAIDGNANATSYNTVSISNGLAGVGAFAINGDATATNNAEVSVSNGFVGVGALSIGGNATATANANIDPPFIGVSSFTIGSGTAQSNVAKGVAVSADGIGVFGGNIGTGEVDINVGKDATVTATPGFGGVGIAALKLGDGNVAIDVGANASVTGDSFGVTALAVGPSGHDTVKLTNNGTITNRTAFIPTILSVTDGGTEIDNNSGATIKNSGGLPYSPIIATIGGQLTVNNSGDLVGSIAALTTNGGDNVINNKDGGTWTTSGLNAFATGGDNVINNNAGGLINSVGLSVFAFANGGTSTVNNSGEFRVSGTTNFVGLENFNNAGGRLNMQDGSITDSTTTTGNFNGGAGSRLAIDAKLGASSGLSLSDFLGVGGNTNSGTAVEINDTIPHQAGAFNRDGVIFALVAGSTASGDFYAANGPIDKGLFSYDVFLNPDFKGEGFDAWVIASTPDATFFELPSIVTAAQTMWHQANGVWLDRTADLRTTLIDGCPQAASLKDPSGPCAPGLKSAVWAKGWGFNQDRDTSQSFALYDRSFHYGIDTNQTGYGVVGGVDLVRFREATATGTSAWVFGVLGGYTHSDLDFSKSTTNVGFDAGTVGAYATYLNGGWFVDSKFSADIGTVDYSNWTTNLSAKDNSSFASYGFTIDSGYRTNLGFGTFIEPGATLSYVRTNVDSLNLYGTEVNFDDGDSLLGRIGVRVGTAFVHSAYRVEPFLGMSGLYEFLGDNTASLTSNGFKLSANDNTTGALGEVSGGVNLFTLDNSGTSAFAKGNFLFGEDDLIGYSGQVGVRVGW
ncbi:autotransporter outer membrane beta-barrel domain-containing protein [Hyphomicrobium sp. 99]|uniref:beta strand repeat-containing protein n=1 Tax=Hyphomicrobium sp. 99 TaxID=1163419 RepID=UPI000695DA0E|nr:autotransporter outer membrane beta-barrel domain-containing protein [Hyphomicrobium sp. 99]